MQMKQIQDFGKMHNNTPRHTIRIVQELERREWIKKARIEGQRRRKGYIINEDNIGTLSETVSKSQKDISKFINQWRKDYRNSLVRIKPSDSKIIKKIKENRNEIFNWAQLVDMYHCIQLIAEIEWSLRTGSLGSGKGKRDLAERNIRKLEGFIEEMSKDLKERDEHIWKTTLSSGLTFNSLHDILGIQSKPYEVKPLTVTQKAKLQH